jgi:hypothetical protein
VNEWPEAFDAEGFANLGGDELGALQREALGNALAKIMRNSLVGQYSLLRQLDRKLRTEHLSDD